MCPRISRISSPNVDIESPCRFPPCLFGQGEALVRIRADRQLLSRTKTVGSADIASGIEAAEQAFQAVDLGKDGLGGLAGVGFVLAGDENLEKSSHGLVRKAVD